MICGTVCIEEIVINFAVITDPHSNNTVNYTVSDTASGIAESFNNVAQHKFFKALAIAVHNDGTPNYDLDYPDAESIMGDIRWIP